MYWPLHAREGKSFWACTYPRAREPTSGSASLRISRTEMSRISLIACVDGLKGFPDTIASVFPQTTVQLCIVHQIRNSVKYVASRNQKEFMRDLKLVYQAVNKDAAEKAIDDLEIKWGEDYPIVIKNWSDN